MYETSTGGEAYDAYEAWESSLSSLGAFVKEAPTWALTSRNSISLGSSQTANLHKSATQLSFVRLQRSKVLPLRRINAASWSLLCYFLHLLTLKAPLMTGSSEIPGGCPHHRWSQMCSGAYCRARGPTAEPPVVTPVTNPAWWASFQKQFRT